MREMTPAEVAKIKPKSPAERANWYRMTIRKVAADIINRKPKNEPTKI
jgi:hypothetical protein